MHKRYGMRKNRGKHIAKKADGHWQRKCCGRISCSQSWKETQYRQILGIIRLGKRSINEEMVREGWMGMGLSGVSARPVCQRVHQRGGGSKREEARAMAAVQSTAALGVQKRSKLTYEGMENAESIRSRIRVSLQYERFY
jgi:hypothetical protein